MKNLKEQITKIKSMMGLIIEDKSKNITTTQKTEDKVAQEYKNAVNKLSPNEIKKIRLIFPGSFWERMGLYYLQSLGIVTGVFTNLTDAIIFISKLKEKKVKADEFVVGSHGDAGRLLITMEDTHSYRFDNSFLYHFKGVIKPTTKVFFTACEGANFLDTLKDAAEKLGVGVYGAAGKYNYIANESEEGFYWCSPNAYSPQMRYVTPFEIENKDMILKVLEDDEIDASVTITFLKPFFGFTIKPIKHKLRHYDDEKIELGSRRHKVLNKMYFKINNVIESAVAKIPEFPKVRMWETIIQQFNSGGIKITLEYSGKSIDIKTLPKKIEVPIETTNKYLLDKRLCIKLNQSPINWFDI